MSGSKTDIFTPNPVPTGSGAPAMNTAGPSGAETPRNGDKTPKNKSVRAPVNFKLNLINEVKKHDIIWQDRKEKKNRDLLNDAWQKIRKVLLIKKPGFCEKQWKLLCHGYRSHINRNVPMHPDLIREMAFMAPQLKKSASDVEPSSDTETGEADSPARNKAQTPKPKKVAKTNSQADTETEDQKASVAILKMLFATVPPETMQPVKNSLVEVFIKVLPEVEAKIYGHAKQQLSKCGDINKIDWSTLDVPAEICKAVWDCKVTKTLLTV